ncbi:Acyl carrier protein 2 [Hibiscus syriacus]|uniref:Acyl carrier protein n=1 Tax=Hibiscus syriacus TaxID=106335 RepID=A0A6A2ZDL7_HIBSY|nr:Acyl carrier protein 2 [Hibiscus syriacus]
MAAFASIPACSLASPATFSIAKGSYSQHKSFSTTADPETLKTVQNTIAKQLSIDVSSVTPETKFADLGADSLDTFLTSNSFQVEIVMALEEQFRISVGEDGAENIATVQDASDLIEKVKAA